ncbi:MAG: Fe-S cluster assembly protein SufD, partial [Chloroflexota bacterium]
MTRFTREALVELSNVLVEPAWMRDFRLEAFEQYEQLPVPTTEDEPWRLTNIRRLKLDEIGPSLNGNGAANNLPAYLGEQLTEDATGGILVEVDGVVVQFELDQVAKDQGIVFCDMHTAVREHGDLVRKHFMTEAVRVNEGKFAALHGAFWRGGTFLYVPRGVKAPPMHSALWSNSGKTFSHTLVVL